VAGQSIAYTANALPTGVTISGSNVTGTPTVVGNTISVITATAANTNRTATRTFTWVVSVSSDAFFKNTTLLLNGEGTSANNGSNNNIFIDSSNNNFTITRVGNTSQGSFSPYSVTGWSNFFDGTTDFITAVGSGAVVRSSGSFTIEGWYYPTSSAASFRAVYSSGTGYATAGRLYQNNTTLTFYWAGSGGITGSIGWTLNTWNHFAVTWDGTTTKVYVNGQQSISSTSPTYSGTVDLSIGESTYSPFGYISNFRIVNSVVYSATFTPSTTPLTAIANTSLLTCQSNRIIDNSPNSFTLTRNGDVSVQAFGPFGSIPEAVPISYSTYLNGSSYVTVPSTSADSLFGSGNYTVEFWTKTDDTSWEMIAPETGVGLALIIASGNLILQNQYGQAGILTVSASSILNNAWHHVAVVRNSGTITIYFDGTSVGTAANSTDYSNQNLTYDIGYGNQSAGRYLSGKLSNFRIVNGTAVYTSNFTPPSTPLTNITNTKVLTFQNPTLIDNSSSARSLGVSGTQNIFIDNPFGYTAQSSASYTPSLHGGSAYFDGTGDYLSTPSNSAFAFLKGALTVEMWIYPTATITTPANIGLFYVEETSGLVVGLSSGYLAMGRRTIGYDLTSSYIPPLNTWTHVAVTRSGATAWIFANGVQVGTVTASGGDANNNANYVCTTGLPTLAGNYAGGAGFGYFPGYISDLRVVKGTALYTTGFIPPAAPVIPIANTSLLLNFTNAGIIDQHGSNVIETLGGVQISTAVKKYNNASIYFDGTGDYLYGAWNPNLELGAGNFTIEFWIYAVGGNSLYCWSTDWHYAMSWNYGGASSNRVGIWASSNGSTWNIFNADGGGNGISTGTITANTWTHVALVRNGSAWALYLNGTSAWTGTSSATIITRTDTFRIGGPWPNSGPSDFNGYIDDLRITKGIARYTANFTPPSALPTK
jgi:hypothetical protein